MNDETPDAGAWDFDDWVLGHFDAEPGVSGYLANCPAHDDGSPSLSIGLGDDGRVLLHCFAGCDIDAVLQAAGLDWPDLFQGAEPSGLTPREKKVKTLTVEECDFRDVAYRSILDQMSLYDEHRVHLLGRGLTGEAIERNGYRSITPDSDRLFPKPYSNYKIEEHLLIPGYAYRLRLLPKEEKPRRVICFESRPGILIPVRDARGRIISGQVRRFDPASPKYTWLIRSRAFPHVPLGVKAPVPVVRVTEGPLKADVATCLRPEVPTIAVAGASSWKSALPLLEELGAVEVRLAFDADWKENDGVARSLRKFEARLRERGYRVTIEDWDIKGAKGIDDLFLLGGSPELAASTDDVAASESTSPADAAGGPRPPTPGEPRPPGGPKGLGPKGDEGWPPPTPITELNGQPGGHKWIWEGYIPEAAIVLLTAQWKLGKTTFLSSLLGAMSAGREEFCGKALCRCKTLIVTQENDSLWRERRDRHGLGGEWVFFQRGKGDSPRPFHVRPSMKEWGKFVDHLVEAAKGRQIGLVVIDPLADFWPVEDENNSVQVTDALNPLRKLTDAGVTVLLIHHPKKNGEGNNAHRGSGQLPAFADVLLQLGGSKRKSPPNHRILQATGRFEHPEAAVIELTKEGYVFVGAAEAGAAGQGSAKRGRAGKVAECDRIVNLLPKDGDGLTVKEVHAKQATLGAGVRRLGVRTVRDHLNAAVASGQAVKTSQGTRNGGGRYLRA